MRAAAELGLDLARSMMVGDKPSDVVAGARGGRRRGVLVLTGYGLGEWEYRRAAFEVKPDHVADGPAGRGGLGAGRAATGGGLSEPARRLRRGR